METQRLLSSNFQLDNFIDSDILLLYHELEELTLMKSRGYNYFKAHAAANKKYPWSKIMVTDWTKYKFFHSPHFVPDLNNWHISEGAPEDIKKEFKDAMDKYRESFGTTSSNNTEEKSMSLEEFEKMLYEVAEGGLVDNSPPEKTHDQTKIPDKGLL